jgi:AcrR family transcriptional regulator
MKPKDNATNYKPAEDREKDLKLALLSIQNGLTHNGEPKITIAAVTREAGVSRTLIHNLYPRITRLSKMLKVVPVAPCVM